MSFDAKRNEEMSRGFLALLVLGIVFAVLFADRQHYEQHETAARIEAQQRLFSLHSRLEGKLTGDIQLIKGLASVIANNPDIRQAEFERTAKPLFDGGTNLRNVGAAPDMVIRLMYPMEGNEKAIGLDYRKTPTQAEMAELARATGKLVLAGPLQLAQGGTGIVARVPVYVEGAGGQRRFWGLISAVIDAEKLYRDSGLLDEKLPLEVAIRGKDGKGALGDVFFGRAALFDEHPVLAEMPLPNGTWQLAAAPREGWNQTPEDAWSLRFTILLIGVLMIVPVVALTRSLRALGLARRQAEEEKERLSATLSSTPNVAIQWYDRLGRVVYWNRASELIFGWTAEEVLGKRLDKLMLTREQAQEFDARIERVAATLEASAPFDLEFTHRDGTSRFVHSTLFLIPGEHGPLFVCMDVDITARRQAELALRQSQEQYQHLLDGVGDRFVVFSHRADNGALLYVSDGIEHVFGVPKHRVLNRTWAEAVDWLPGSAEAAHAHLMQLSSGEKNSAHFEMRFRHPDGGVRTIMITEHPVRGEDGGVIRFDGIVEDATERKQREEALRESEARFRQMFEHHSAAMLLIDPETGDIVDANPAAATYYGYPLDILRSMKIEQINTMSEAEIHRAMLQAEKEKLNYFVFDHRLADGTLRSVEVYSSPMHLQGKHLLFSIIHDVSERKRAENDLRVASIAFESQEGMLITDARNTILRVNKAFTEITGYTAEEVVGKNPSMLSSGHHDAAFYSAMWAQLRATGSWTGEILNRRKNGELYPEHLTITAVKNEQGEVTNYVAALMDITQRKAAEEQIRDLAFYDPLTRLPNRRLLLDRLQHALASSARSGHFGALLFIDLDNFKGLNDTMGHDVGDQLLQQVAARLKGCVREGDTVARLGGDEFVLVLEEMSGEESDAASMTEWVCKKIMAALNLPYQLGNHEHTSTPSIGATLFLGHRAGVEELLKQADIAMYQAKKAGRNTLRFFDPVMQSIVTSHIELETDLRRAVMEQEQFLLYYQPQVDASGSLVGVEALVRWRHPVRGMISPADFIPLAEESGLILPLGHWVLTTACQQLADWAKQPEKAGLSMAVNISARQFSLPTIVDEILSLVDYFGIEPSRLKLEITEGMLFENVEDIIAKMTELKARGIRFAMDDFGTGYSSLQYLKRLPLDQLKIDQSFVRDIVVDASDRAIVKTVIAMARSLDLEVIAEGVETAEQRRILLKKGCDHFQGYLFGRPVPMAEFDALFGQLLPGSNG